MFDDDDVEPQLKVVDKYYFEEGKDKPVCFSVLPLKFDENEVAGLESKKLDLRGFADNGLQSVCKQVVAWRVVLNCETPEISVLSSEGNWIGLSKPRKCYGEEIARSILITVQMLHFVRRRPKEHKKSLWHHLCEVFNKFDTKPVEADLRKHRPLIKLIVERNPTLMKSKILLSFIEHNPGSTIEPILRSAGPKEPFIVSDESLASSRDVDDDCSYFEDDSNDNNGSGDTDNDGNTIGDHSDGTDQVCTICDDGGELLSCKGKCKRSFHPREEDGRESNCETLGYTSAQLEEIDSDTYLCKNCEYKQHQCFKCGELEPSDEPNAKVLKCNIASCGHFYHPKCVAPLLEPGGTDGACELGKKIADGMSFTCPIHWCFKCKSMEDRTQRALQIAVCRRCPKSYHRECLPSEISFKTEDEDAPTLAWELSERIFFYCLNHEIDTAIGTPSRDHIKFPSIPEINETKESAGLSNKLSRKYDEQTQRVATNSSTENIVLKPECAAKCSKQAMQFEPSVVEAAAAAAAAAASLSSPEAVKGQEKQLAILSSFVMGTIQERSSHLVDSETDKRVISMPEKETSSGTSQDIYKKCAMPSTNGYPARQFSKIKTDGMYERSVQAMIGSPPRVPTVTNAKPSSHASVTKSKKRKPVKTSDLPLKQRSNSTSEVESLVAVLDNECETKEALIQDTNSLEFLFAEVAKKRIEWRNAMRLAHLRSMMHLPDVGHPKLPNGTSKHNL